MRHANANLIGQPGSRAKLYTPALLIECQVFERNIRRAIERSAAGGLKLRPHAKSHKSIEVARRLMAAGAVGQCCATLGEAEVLVEGGVSGVHITSPVVTPIKIRRLVELNRTASGLMVVVDHPANVEALALATRGEAKPLQVVVDVDPGVKRTGVVKLADGLALAHAVAAAPGLKFTGVQCYAGTVQHVHDLAERRRQSFAALAEVATLLDQLRAAGLAPAIVTGGGTGTAGIDGSAGVLTEVQAGSFLFMDTEYTSVLARDGNEPPYEVSLFVQAAVVSCNHQGFVTVDAGSKSFGTDQGPATPASGAPAGSRYEFFGDEHGKLIFPDGAKASLTVGDRVEFITPHCDTTVNLYDAYHVVDGDTLVAIWPIEARGRH